jgi:hypothetical protein
MATLESVCPPHSMGYMTEIPQALAQQFNVNNNTPKHHFNHCHLIDSIKCKGPAPNTDTALGEAQHPASKKAYEKTNHQTDTVYMQVCTAVLIISPL